MSFEEKKSTCGCQGEMRELEHNIGHVPVFLKELAKSDPLIHEAVLKLDNYIWSDGSLTRKEKKNLSPSALLPLLEMIMLCVPS